MKIAKVCLFVLCAWLIVMWITAFFAVESSVVSKITLAGILFLSGIAVGAVTIDSWRGK